jgi:hypothetical protein
MNSHVPNVKPAPMPDYYRDLGWEQPFIWERADFGGWDAVKKDVDRIFAEAAARQEAEREQRQATRQEQRKAEWQRQKPDAPPPSVEALFQVPEPKPIRLLSPLPPEEQKAENDAQDAAVRAWRKRRQMGRVKAIARENCGHGCPHLIRKQDYRGVTDAMIRFKCGRSDCGACWRRRLFKTIRRATRCLLRVNGKARQGKLYARVIDWSKWDSLNRKLRRLYGSDCGRLHLRTSDHRGLVLCEKPLPDGEELTPGQAVDRVLATIDDLHVVKSAFRLLGCWSDRVESDWELIKHYHQPFDLQLVRDELLKLRKNSLWGWERYPEVQQGLLWQSANLEAANELIRQLEARCHFLTLEADGPTGSESDIPSGGAWIAPGLSPEDVVTAFDTG